MFLKTSYEKYLRREYSIPKDQSIVIKRGFVISKDGDENSTSDPFKIRNLVYKDIKKETSKIYGLIEKVSGQIDDLLRLRESVGDENEQIYDLQIELAVDGLFSELSNSMRDLTNKAYKSFIFRLNENSKDSLESFEYLCNYALRDKEIYVKINLWVENLKKWFLENMESNLYGETNPVLGDDLVTSTKFLSSIESKGFFSDVLGYAEEFFSSLKDKIDRLIFNIVSFIQTRAKRLYFKARRIKKYQVVLSSNSNVCNICEGMAGKIFDIDELNVGTTAPPFHPNCGCTIMPYVESDEEPQDEGDDGAQGIEYVNKYQLEYIGFNNVTDSMVKELNETLIKYDITTKEQISHFLAQCYVESGIWRIEIDWAGDNYDHIIGGPDYRGAGAIHISHKYTYSEFFKYIGIDINEIGVVPYIYVDENYYWESAGWYWSVFKEINGSINSDTTVEQITRIVNGGNGGLYDRKAAYERADKIIN